MSEDIPFASLTFLFSITANSSVTFKFFNPSPKDMCSGATEVKLMTGP